MGQRLEGFSYYDELQVNTAYGCLSKKSRHIGLLYTLDIKKSFLSMKLRLHYLHIAVIEFEDEF